MHWGILLFEVFRRCDAGNRLLGQAEADCLDAGRRMVEEGHAWSIRTRRDRGPLLKQERLASALRRGLHGQPGAVMRRGFRQGHGPCEPKGAAACL